MGTLYWEAMESFKGRLERLGRFAERMIVPLVMSIGPGVPIPMETNEVF